MDESKIVQPSRKLYDTADTVVSKFVAPEGLTEALVRELSAQKNEPAWMLEKRLAALELFLKTPVPVWGAPLSGLDLSKIIYFVRPDTDEKMTWEEVPEDIRRTFEKLGIPEAERNSLSGVGAQYDSDVVYHNLKKEWEEQGVIFENMDVAVQKYPEMVRQYFMTDCVPIHDHKFVMLHGAVWSGGTFIYVPKGVRVNVPLQAYFRMNAERGGQFEHTLIVVDEGAEVQYIEGCSAPKYNASSLHAGCVEVHVKRGARVTYSSIENWSKNTFNLNTKRAVVDDDGVIEWLNGNMGSGVTMLYPMSVLRGARSRSEHVGVAFAGAGQNQDTGAKVVHLAPETSSVIRSKSISKDGGVSTYRGLVRVGGKASGATASVACDALVVGDGSVSNTYPFMRVDTNDVVVAHEASVGRIGDEEVFALMSRGIQRLEAERLVVRGFLDPIVKRLPLEYAVELTRLIELEMEGSVG